MEKKTMMEIGWNLYDSYAHLPQLFFSFLKPSPVDKPSLLLFNEPLARELGLNPKALKTKEGLAILAGNTLPEGARPLAQAYGGHQFGYFTMLGDGRAHLLGEQINPKGERFDIQLKGSGKTPYSRQGDGRAPLAAMLREYIISEAMAALGVPTSRSLAVIKTGEYVQRHTREAGGILCRVAQSHLRVGTFEFASQWGQKKDLEALALYAIRRHYPEALEKDKPYLAFLEELVKKQAALLASWQLIGFVHGVMNTDNMTISGETIDYGPCAFMDTYSLDTVFSSIDSRGRYAYGNQPQIALWNLSRFAETLLPLIHKREEEAISMAQKVVEKFSEFYYLNWSKGMRGKLGLTKEKAGDGELFKSFLTILAEEKKDYTNSFIALTKGETFFKSEKLSSWIKDWHYRLSLEGQSKEEVQRLMEKHNPYVIPRNHKVDEAIELASKKGNLSKLLKLLKVLEGPYDYFQDIEEDYLKAQCACRAHRTFCGT